MKIGIVLVTFNRLNDLKETLKAYEAQTVPPAFVMTVDNKSTDGTIPFLKEWEGEAGNFSRKVLYLPENIGGSGGFCAGMEKALETDCDWVFVADDDAVPHPDMLEKLIEFANNHPKLMDNVASLCTSVHNRDHFSGIHRCRLKKGLLGACEMFVAEDEYKKEYFDIDIFSFVGAMIKREVLQKAGVARGDFFIYNDDYEHAVRVGKCGKILCVPASVMEHADNLVYTREATWRDYYATRNAVIMHLDHFGKYAGFMRAMRRLAVAFSTFNTMKIKVIFTAVRDGYKGKTGIHPVYKPGWKAGK